MDIFPTAFIKIAILLNPFAVLTTFLALTAGKTPRERTAIVARTCGAVAVAGLAVLFSGNALLAALGVGLAPFKVGGGVVLMVCSITLVWGSSRNSPAAENADGSISVVPLAIPMALGPGTAAGLMIIGSEYTSSLATAAENAGALLGGVAVLGAVLSLGIHAEKLLNRNAVAVVTKLTGLLLSGIAAGMILEGARSYLVR